MMPPPIPADEAARFAALVGCGVLGTPAESQFDDVVRIAAQLCGAPIALVTLVASDEQWFKARVGIDLPSTSRDVSFCAHALETRELVVHDAASDDRFADNPLVTGPPHIRFYAGIPLHVDEGSAVGTLCIMDRVPRHLTPDQLESLHALARHVATELRLRREVLTARAHGPNVGGVAVRPGDTVGRWRVEAELGRGGVGVVFAAKDGSGARAALKVLLPQYARNQEIVERFAREARVLSQLSSRHVTRIYEVGNLGADAGGFPYIAMELLEGSVLRKVLDKRGSLPWRDASRYAVEACDALGEAHARSFVHRDVKPSNLFLAASGAEPPSVKVLDFGIAKLAALSASEGLTQDGSTFGSMHYMSPEQMLGAGGVDARADIWSLGVTLYEAIAGRRPFKGEGDLAVCVATLHHDPVPLRTAAPQVPGPLADVVDRCLAKARQERYPDARELGIALVAVSG